MRSWRTIWLALCAAGCATATADRARPSAEALVAECRTEPREIPGWPPLYDPIAAREVRGLSVRDGSEVSLPLAYLLHRADVESCAHLAACRDSLGQALLDATAPEGAEPGLRPMEWLAVGAAGGLVIGVGTALVLAWALSSG